MDVREQDAQAPRWVGQSDPVRIASRRRRTRAVLILAIGLAIGMPWRAAATYRPLATDGCSGGGGFSEWPDRNPRSAWEQSFSRINTLVRGDLVKLREYPGRGFRQWFTVCNTGPLGVTLTGIDIPLAADAAETSLVLPAGLDGRADFSTTTPFEPTMIAAGSYVDVGFTYRFRECPAGTSPRKDLLTARFGGTTTGWSALEVRFKIAGIPRSQTMGLRDAVEIRRLSDLCR